MKYAIVDTNKKTRFAGRDYDSAEEAERRLEVLKGKFGERHALAVVGVDGDGNFQKPTDRAEKASSKAPNK